MADDYSSSSQPAGSVRHPSFLVRSRAQEDVHRTACQDHSGHTRVFLLSSIRMPHATLRSTSKADTHSASVSAGAISPLAMRSPGQAQHRSDSVVIGRKATRDTMSRWSISQDKRLILRDVAHWCVIQATAARRAVDSMRMRVTHSRRHRLLACSVLQPVSQGKGPQ